MARSITAIPARGSRINTAQQLEPQVSYYTTFIDSNPDYEFAWIFADEGITGTNTKKREQFNKMIEDCKDGKIDMIITKSISRFAKNSAPRKR